MSLKGNVDLLAGWLVLQCTMCYIPVTDIGYVTVKAHRLAVPGTGQGNASPLQPDCILVALHSYISSLQYFCISRLQHMYKKDILNSLAGCPRKRTRQCVSSSTRLHCYVHCIAVFQHVNITACSASPDNNTLLLRVAQCHSVSQLKLTGWLSKGQDRAMCLIFN